jgi:hypothetical protein
MAANLCLMGLLITEYVNLLLLNEIDGMLPLI